MIQLREFIKENQVAIVIGFIGLFVVILYWYYAAVPLSKKIKAKEETLVSLENELRYLQMRLEGFELIRMQYEQIKAQLAVDESYLPVDVNMPQLIRDITSSSNLANVKLESFAPQPMLHGEVYDEIPIKLSLKGDYHSLAEFLAHLGNLERVITPTFLTFKGQELTEKEEATVAIDLEIKSYIYKPQL